MKEMQLKRALSAFLAAAMAFTIFVTPGVTARASAEGQPLTPPNNMGAFPVKRESVTYKDGDKDAVYYRSVRDPNIRPDHQLKLTSDNDYLVRTFQRSMDYTYDELVVGPRQFPLDTTGDDNRVRNHYEGIGPYTSTAVPSIWGTYHGFPTGGYRECFCDRDVSHTAEACSILSLNEENYAMMERFAEESVEIFWRGTMHGQTSVGEPGAVWENEKKDALRWFPLWSQDFYGDAYYMDASFRELPAPFEVLDKIWTQYRWTGDARWISDAMLNYGYRIHDEEDGLMDWYDYDGDGMVDNVRDYGWAPTLYEYEDASEMQTGQVTVDSKDKATGNSEFKYETVVTIQPDFFQKHDNAFYQLPIDAKIIGVDEPKDVGNVGEQVFVLNNMDKTVTDLTKPAVLRNYDRLSSRAGDIRDVVIPLYTPDDVSIELYEGRHKLRPGTDYTVDSTTANYPVVTLKKEFFGNTGYPAGSVGAAGYLEKKINLGIVTRFYKSGTHTEENELSRATTELYLNAGNVTPEKDRMQLENITMTVGDKTTDITKSCKENADHKTGVIYLDYYSEQPTSYTLTIHHRTPITPRMTDPDSGRPKDLKEYFKVTSDLVRVLLAGDTVGCQYQALRGMADMIRARVAMDKTKLEIYHYEKMEKKIDKTITLTEALADEYDARADAVQQQVWSTWVNPKWGYARAVNRMGELDTGWGHENSFFMPAKELLAPGEPTQKYLNFIQMNALLGTALNEEALTYMAEAFYMSGQNVTGWQWSKNSMSRLDEKQRDDNQIMSTYPEIAMINIYNTINLLMGVEPGASTTAVSTLPRLTSEVDWVQAENIPLTQSGRDSLGTSMLDDNGDRYYGLDSAGNPRDIGFSKPKQGTLYTVKQDGTHTTTFTNQGLDGNGKDGAPINWTAQFYSVDNQNDPIGYTTLYKTVNGGEQTEITGGQVKHTTLPPYTTYTELTVAPGETVTVSTRKDPTKAAPNTKGELYLSDFDWAFASYPQSTDAGSLVTGAPKRDMSYAGTTLYESSFLKSYAKGLGTKVADNQGTTLRYMIPGNATTFTATAILTDYPRTNDFEVDAGATNAIRDFEVYVDGVKMGDTVTVGAGGDLSARGVTVKFSFNDDELHTLDLVTSKNPSSGTDSTVGAAWADAKVAVPAGTDELPPELPETNMYLSDLSPDATTGKVVVDAAAEENKAITMGGRVFQKGVSMSGKASATFDLSGIYQSLTFTMGKQDGKSMNGELQIFLGDRQVYTATAAQCDNGPVTHTVELKNEDDTYAGKVKLLYTGDQGVVNFADGLLTLVEGTDLTDPAIIAKRILKAPDATLGMAAYGFPAIPVKSELQKNYTISVNTSSNEAVIAKSGTITPKADGDGCTVDLTFKIAEQAGEKAGEKREGITKSFTVYVPAAQQVPLDRISWLSAGPSVRLNTDSNGQKLKVDGTNYDNGVGLRAGNGDSVVYDLSAVNTKRFTGTVGYAQNSGSNSNDLLRVKFEGIKTVAGKEQRDVLHFTPVLGKGEQSENTHLAGCATCQQEIMNYGYANSDQVDFDLDGYEKLVVTPVNAGNSYGGNGALVHCYFHLTSPYLGAEVQSLAEVSIDTVAAQRPALPAQVTATYEGIEGTRKLPVTWASINSGDYDTVGKKFDVEGDVRGTDQKAVCHVTVVDKIPLTVAKATCKVKVYTAPTMPETVHVKYTGDSEGDIAVLWENVPKDGWTRPGTAVVYGSIAGSALRAVCAVEVYDPNAIYMATIAPESYTAGNGWGLDEPYQLGDGLTYEHSIFAHAPSTVIYDLADKDYTRFITAVGSKNPVGNFRVKGYGVNGSVETLLFSTDMVSRVGTANDGTSENSTGYNYIGGDTVVTVDANITGYDQLKLVADMVDGANSDHCIYGTPMLYTAASRVGQDLHTVTVTTGVGGAIWPNGKVAVRDGEDLLLTIKPNPVNEEKPDVKQMGIDTIKVGDVFLSVKNDLTKNADGTYTYTIKNVTADRAVAATFAVYELEDLSAKVNLAPGNGKITIGAMPAAPGGGYYFKHTTTTDAASKPLLDSDFVPGATWTLLDGSKTVSVPNGYTYFFQVVKAVDGQVKGWGEASATPDPTLFTVAVTGGVIGDKDSIVTAKSFHTGNSVTVTAKVPGGKQFDKWKATGVALSDAAAPSVTFTMLSADVTLTAEFIDILNIPLATMEPISKTAPNGWNTDKTKTFKDNKSYEHSIHAHAPSEAIFDLGGGYTRFTTKVGVSNEDGGGSQATSFISEAYGVDAKGQETLLYATNMVTALGIAGDTGAANNGADEKGYYYVTSQAGAMCDVDVDITGYQQLKLMMNSGMTSNADHASYATPMLYTEHDPDRGVNFHTVTVTSGEFGAVWPNGKVAVDDGAPLVLTIQPNPKNAKVPGVTGSYLDAVLVDGAGVAVKPNGDGTYTLTLPAGAADHTVDVSFLAEKPTLTPVLTAGNGKLRLAAMTPAAPAVYYYKCGTDAGSELAIDSVFVPEGWTAFASNTVIDKLTNGTTYYVQTVKVVDVDDVEYVKAWGQGSEAPDEHAADQVAVDMSGIVAGGTYTGAPMAFTGTATGTYGDNQTYTGAFIYTYAGRNGTVYVASTTAPTDAGEYTLTAEVDSTDFMGEGTLDFTITKAPSEVDPIDPDAPEADTITAVYGESVTVEFTPEIGAISKATPIAVPVIDQAALFLGDTQLTESVTADGNGKFTLTYDTAEQGIPVGTSALTVRYGGSGNLTDGEGTIQVTLTAKAVTITGLTATRAYDGTTALPAETFSGGSLTGVASGDTVTVKNGVGTVEDASAGAGKAVTCTGFTLEGADKAFYTLTAQPAATAEITKAVFAGALAKDVAIVKNQESAQTGTLTVADFATGSGWMDAAITGVTSGDGSVIASIALEDGTIAYESVANLNSDGAETFTVTIESRNYESVEATLTFTPTDKLLVVIDGVTVTGKTYDGAAIAPVGNPRAKLEEETVVVSEFTAVWLDEAGETLENPPTDAGSYRYVISVSEDDSAYTGTLEIPFTIEKAQITAKLADSSLYVGDTLPETFALALTGLVNGESLDTDLEPTFSGLPEDSGKTGSYPITWTNLAAMKAALEALPAARNYTIACEDTCTLTISDRPAPPPSNTETVKEKNEDGSTTTTVTNKRTGTVTETTKWPDGKVEMVETKKDGTVTEKVTTPDGTKTEAVKNPDGSRTATEERKDGTKVESETNAEGSTTASVTVPKDADKVAVTIPTTRKPKPGEVVVIVKEDGSREIIKTAVATEEGMKLVLTENAKLAIIDNSKDFADVAGEDWFYDAVQFTASREIFAGTGKDIFNPGGDATRAAIFTVLARLDGADTQGGDTWYAKGVDWAVKTGISDGATPEENISREQFAAMLYRYAGSPETSGSCGAFTDAGAVSSWAESAMRWAVETGILRGSGKLLNPGGSATRVETAAMLQRFVENAE